ncbi:hypothetical protein UlMin_023093 [Ulmus minor]
MDRKKVKLHSGAEFTLAAEDRISRLPDDIIHHILSSFTTRSVARLSILSKRWNYLSNAVPFLYFTSSIKKFCLSVNRCLKRRENDLLSATNTPISSFKLVRKCYARNIYIDRCLNFLAQSGNLKELDLEISLYSNKVYSLPQGILNMRSLTLLMLRHVSLEGIVSVDLPSLISLTLDRVTLNDQILPILLSGCSSIEKLCLIRSLGNMSNPKFSSLTLKSLEIYVGFTKIEIEARNLQSLVLNFHVRYNFNHSSCGKIQKLSLASLDSFTDGKIEDLIFQLPLLEDLAICFCSKIKNLKICKQHLKHFVFEENDCCPEAVITIDTPNLVSFRFRQTPLLFNFSMIAPNILNADLNIHGPKTYDFRWYLTLHTFLAQFDTSKQLRLRLISEEDIIFPTKFRRTCRPPMPTLKHLKITPHSTMSMSSDMKDRLLWLAPSATVSIEDSKFFRDKIFSFRN